MRQNFLVVIAFGLLLSCSNADTTKTLRDTAVVAKKADLNQTKPKRQILIEELKRFQLAFASKDKEKIAAIFQFPLSDTSIGIYIDDSTYNEQFKQNGDKTTRAMFVHFFPQISESIQIDELNQLFKNIRLDGLHQKDTIEHETHIKTEPCYKFYSIIVDKDLVILTTGSGVNDKYQSLLLASGEDVQDNSSEFCESVLWWEFRFDGEKLHFVKQHGAG